MHVDKEKGGGTIVPKKKKKETEEETEARVKLERFVALEDIAEDEVQLALKIGKQIVKENGVSWEWLALPTSGLIVPWFDDGLPYYDPGEAMWNVPDLTHML